MCESFSGYLISRSLCFPPTTSWWTSIFWWCWKEWRHTSHRMFGIESFSLFFLDTHMSTHLLQWNRIYVIRFFSTKKITYGSSDQNISPNLEKHTVCASSYNCYLYLVVRPFYRILFIYRGPKVNFITVFTYCLSRSFYSKLHYFEGIMSVN